MKEDAWVLKSATAQHDNELGLCDDLEVETLLDLNGDEIDVDAPEF